MRKNVLLGLVAAALLTGCNAARVVAPLDAGEWRVGGALGGPQINTGRLPLISVYTAHGATEKRTDYVGLQVVSAAFQTLHLDAGSLRRIGAGGGMGSWKPEVNAFGGGTLLVGLRDGATRVYPNAGFHTVWTLPLGFKPYAGTDLWVDPTYRLAEFNQGTLLHPNLHGGLRWIGKHVEAGIEAYLETCAHMGKQPEKSYKGVFNVRINPELHRKLAIRAQQEHTTLNKLVERSLEESIGAV